MRKTGMVALVATLGALAIAALVGERDTPAPLAVAAGPATVAPARPAASPAVPVKTATPSRVPPAVDLQPLAARRLVMPVQGYDALKLRDNFDDKRGASRRHEALDIMAPRGTPVVAVDDGVVAKLFRSGAGGITIYQYDPAEKFVYYYAHLDRYRDGLKEGQAVKRGEVIGYVGSTGNAPEGAPHLHFTIFLLGPDKRWWRGTPVNPFPYLAAR